MAVLVSIELSTLWFSVNTLSAVRSYVEGEGLWSKAQKDAVYHLRIYTFSHDEKDYQDFLDFLKVPLGDRKARLELAKPEPDFATARQGFIEGRNHPDDVDGMIKLIRRFHDVYYIHRAFVIWGQAESKMEQLIPLGEKLHVMISSKSASQADINKVLTQTEFINRKLTKLEDDFSFTLGEGSRWLENIVLRILLALSLTIGTTSILITVSVSRGIEKGLKAIIDGAALIRKGLFGTRVQVYSKDEIGVLATAFNEMTITLEYNMMDLKNAEDNLIKERDRAEASEKVKQLFLANMSHEIRTPMNAILGFARLLEEALTDKELLEYIHIIIKSGDDLLVILNDILDFSRIEAGKVNFEQQPFSLKSTVDSILLMMESKAQQKNLRIKSNIDQVIPKILIGDSVRLSQIMLNLVSNAIKFSDNGEIDIAITMVDENSQNLIIDFVIKDTGIGIPLEMQGKIFESFEQATTDTIRKFGGTGLGLSIAKQLVEMQDGKIFVKSEPNKGSEFYFRLPFLKEKSRISKNNVAVNNGGILEKSGKGVKVLVVEDNTINQMLIVKVLQKRDFEIDVAENGVVALNRYKNKDYNIILMDLQMPEMDGYETTRRIRSMEAPKKDTPIMAMTAHTIKGERERCLAIGMNDYVPKPFNVAELLEKIFELVK
ncbi:response regulator [Mucilaginibacter sp. dw_454]|uniref:response regulator n=1 Tax=Mucilaginibacter sp. dw_454 TaxID=2720079 RepID=UPI001BD53C8B|nr:response regulator [Mucilaginibacter sp. dw_454]